MATSTSSYLLRGEVRLRAGDRLGALADVERGLILDRDDPELLVFRGRLAIENGKPDAGLRWLDLAILPGATGMAQSWRARALIDLGRTEEAVHAWTAALASDPEDAPAYLGRARAFRRLGLWENALDELERAAERTPDGSADFIRVTLDYLACIPVHPDRLPRVASLVLRLLIGPTSLPNDRRRLEARLSRIGNQSGRGLEP